MKKLLLALALFLIPAAASAQCTGIFPASTVCGVTAAGPSYPGPLPLSSFALTPGGSIGQLQYNNGSGGLGGAPGDCSVVLGSVVCTGSAGAFGVTTTLSYNSLIQKVRSSGAATVTVSATTDYLLCLDPTSNAIAVNLPTTPATGLTYVVKDCTGKAYLHSITITPAAGNIDGAANYVINSSYVAIAITYTGSQWSIQ